MGPHHTHHLNLCSLGNSQTGVMATWAWETGTWEVSKSVSCCPLWDDCSVLLHFSLQQADTTWVREVLNNFVSGNFNTFLIREEHLEHSYWTPVRRQIQGLYQLLVLDSAVTAASLAVRFPFQVTTLEVLLCFLLSPLALMGQVSSVLVRN